MKDGVTEFDKKRVEAQAAAYMRQVFQDGDWTESLAAFYAAAQVIEREMMSRTGVDPQYLLQVQLVGKRIGVAMEVRTEIETINTDIQ